MSAVVRQAGGNPRTQAARNSFLPPAAVLRPYPGRNRAPGWFLPPAWSRVPGSLPVPAWLRGPEGLRRLHTGRETGGTPQSAYLSPELPLPARRLPVIRQRKPAHITVRRGPHSVSLQFCGRSALCCNALWLFLPVQFRHSQLSFQSPSQTPRFPEAGPTLVSPLCHPHSVTGPLIPA